MKRLALVGCLFPVLALNAVATSAVQSEQKPAQVQKQKLVANAADVDFALQCAESAIRQYNALPEAKKKKLEAQVAKAAGVKDVNNVSQTMRMMATQLGKAKTFVTKENREAAKTFLDANPKWCGTVKAARIGQQAMQKMGMKGDLSLDDMVNLLPE